MKPWFAMGLAASLLYGISAILFKLLTETRYLSGRPGWVLAGIGTGIALCGILGATLWPSAAATQDTTMRAYLWAIPAGQPGWHVVPAHLGVCLYPFHV